MIEIDRNIDHAHAARCAKQPWWLRWHSRLAGSSRVYCVGTGRSREVFHTKQVGTAKDTRCGATGESYAENTAGKDARTWPKAARPAIQRDMTRAQHKITKYSMLHYNPPMRRVGRQTRARNSAQREHLRGQGLNSAPLTVKEGSNVSFCHVSGQILHSELASGGGGRGHECVGKGKGGREADGGKPHSFFVVVSLFTKK